MEAPYNFETMNPFNSPTGPEHTNATSSPVTITGSYSYTFHNKVWGAGTSSPPWSANYDGIHDSGYTVNRSYSLTLPARKGGIVFDRLNVYDGAESWIKTGEPMATRNRLLYQLVEAEYLQTWHLPPQGGG